MVWVKGESIIYYNFQIGPVHCIANTVELYVHVILQSARNNRTSLVVTSDYFQFDISYTHIFHVILR